MQRKILAADDNSDLLELFKVLITPPQYLLETTHSKKKFLSKLKSFKPDMVILDVFLDEEDGREMCKKIRENEKSKHIGILMISGNPYALEKYQLFGADAFLKKPFSKEDLHAKIEQVLTGQTT